MLKDEDISWGIPVVTRVCSTKMLGRKSGKRVGFVLLSEMELLPWGVKGKRGGIYTWEDDIEWDCTQVSYLLLMRMSIS